MKSVVYVIFLFVFLLAGLDAFSQFGRSGSGNPRSPTRGGQNGRQGGNNENIDERLRPKEKPANPVSTDALLDSLRKKDEARQDSVVFTARYIRYTTLIQHR